MLCHNFLLTSVKNGTNFLEKEKKMALTDILKTLSPGFFGPQAELLQLGLTRAGYPAAIDGAFGLQTEYALKNFQADWGLEPDGIAGPRTWRALLPFLTGYVRHTVKPGDTMWTLSRMYGTSVGAIGTANPDAEPYALRPGQALTVPLAFDVVPVSVRFTSTVLALCADGLAARYPFIRSGWAGTSVMGKRLHLLTMGAGASRVFYNASHHANEWITSPLVMRFFEDCAAAFASGGTIYGQNARALFEKATLSLMPMVNPDGVDLVTGELDDGPYYDQARRYARSYPAIRFPEGWKANINGVDLNLQYPAGWENAREIKFSQGFTTPGPRDFVGDAPLSQPESRAAYDLTRSNDFSLTISFHTQGKVIYWKYLDFEPKNAYEIAQKFSAASGYAIEETPYASGFAGYKDWFISAYDRPGYTVEVGEGVAPLPLGQLPAIYGDCLGILVIGLDPGM
jgi:g-D-glutamyl-meso-diaminopimelate peptidase